MTNWKLFEVKSGWARQTYNHRTNSSGFATCLTLDNYVEFRDGYEKDIYVSSWNTTACGASKGFIEIDQDIAKYKSKGYTFNFPNEVRNVPTEVARRRNAMIQSASVDPTALAITLEGMDRVDRNESNEFEYKMEDARGNKHEWIYRKR